MSLLTSSASPFPAASRGLRGGAAAVLGGSATIAAVDGPGKLRLGQAGALRETYLAKLAAHRDRIASACRRQGWTFAVHRTDRPATEALLRLATLLADSGTEAAGGF